MASPNRNPNRNPNPNRNLGPSPQWFPLLYPHQANETEAFLAAHKDLKVTAIGAKAVTALPGAKASINEANPSALSVAVAKQFLADAKVMGVATTEDFADALTGGAHVAAAGGPLVLLPKETPAEVSNWMKDLKQLTMIYVYGGETRISKPQADALAK